LDHFWDFRSVKWSNPRDRLFEIYHLAIDLEFEPELHNAAEASVGAETRLMDENTVDEEIDYKSTNKEETGEHSSYTYLMDGMRTDEDMRRSQ
jgi:hypothetical protein